MTILQHEQWSTLPRPDGALFGCEGLVLPFMLCQRSLHPFALLAYYKGLCISSCTPLINVRLGPGSAWEHLQLVGRLSYVWSYHMLQHIALICGVEVFWLGAQVLVSTIKTCVCSMAEQLRMRRAPLWSAPVPHRSPCGSRP